MYNHFGQTSRLYAQMPGAPQPSVVDGEPVWSEVQGNPQWLFCSTVVDMLIEAAQARP